MRYILALVGLFGTGVLAMSFATGTNVASVFLGTTATERACLEAIQTVHGSSVTKESVLLTKTNIQTNRNPDYIAQLTSDAYCGTNGCLFEICTTNAQGEASVINLGYAGMSLTPASTNSNGMFDLILNDDFRLSWTDGQYTIVE